ncbi:LysM peptidoglycan-binding domain-containing protein [Virgibacillus ainsalahensis]
MKKVKFLAPLLALGMILGLGVSTVHAEKTTITMEKGDTLWSIAQAYEDVTVNDLYEWNPGITIRNIPVGTEITMETDSNKDMPNEVFHTVSPGDTLYSIGNLEDVILGDLYALNPNIEPQNLQIGSKVRINRSDGYSKEYYTIKPGSTLFTIANIHTGVTLKDLYDLNPGINPQNLQIGSEIRVK